MGERTLRSETTPKKILISLGSSLVLALFVLFIGLIIGFSIQILGYINPSMNQIPGNIIDPTDYDLELARIGFYQPISVQFIIYIKNFFTGNWGNSLLLLDGTPLTEVMKRIIPGTIETMVLPMIIGLVGIKLGRIWVKKRNKIQGYIIRIFTVIGLATPIFFLATWMQYTFFPILPVIYRHNPLIPDAPFITGLPLFDAIFGGNWVLAGDLIVHGVLPTISLSILVLALITKFTQINLDRNSKDTSFVTNSFTAAKIFGILFALVLMVEVTFNITGFGYYVYMSLIIGEINFFISCIFMIIILFSLTMFFSNMIPIAYKFIRNKLDRTLKSFRKKIHQKFKPFREKISSKFQFPKFRHETSPSISKPEIELDKNNKTNPKVILKEYIIATLKNPFTLVGLGIFVYIGFISAFPQLFTLYSLDDITHPISIFETPYLQPSPLHPLGTTAYGFDILARLIYSTRDALIFGSVITFIGLVGGSIFGFAAGRLHRYVHKVIIGSMITLFVIPSLILLMVSRALYGRSAYLSIMTIGILLITIFTGIVANAIRRESNYIKVIKVIIKYIPLEMTFGIMIYQLLGFIGFGDKTTANLGVTFGYGRGAWPDFGPVFWPGFYLFLIMLSLLLLHEGLSAPITPREVLIEPVISS